MNPAGRGPSPPGGRSRRRASSIDLVVAVLFATLLVAACASPVEDAAGTTTSVSPPRDEPPLTVPLTTVPMPTTTTFPLAPVDPVAWAPCGAGFDCATLEVPVDHRDHDGPRLSLALVRRPAADPGQRIGSVLVNPGGPGASGVARVRRGFVVSDEVAARFDIVGFDPRGVGSSSPLGCGGAVAAFRYADLDPDDAAEEAELEAAARAVAEECERSDGDRLGHLGTVDVARDVELIRRALGEDQISFVGLSYGTLVGLLWADAHPDSVRALVVDAVVDPSAERASLTGDQAAAVEQALESIDAACRDTASCPLAERGVLAAYDELAARVEDSALPGLGPTRLAYAAIMATYDTELWPRLWDGLAAALDGDGAGLVALAERFTSLVDYAAFAAVSCLDGKHPQGYQAWRAAGHELAEASPRFGRIISNELLPCAFWPQATLEPRPVRVAGGPPVLLIGSTGDVATPLANAERVATQLADGHLLTVEADRHVSLSWNGCAQDAAARYLITLVVPAPGQRC